jgi:glycosyltransferase involved in cell wall biosynthesis
LVPKVDAAYTVCDSIAEVYRDLYKVNFKVVRNLPVCSETEKVEHQEKPEGQSKVILYQGALNLGRGVGTAIRAIQYLEGVELWLAGDGDLTSQLKEMVVEMKLESKVKFLGRLPLHQLHEVTRLADLGISLEEDLGLNYRFALPNKLFDYIQAGVPVLVSNLPEMRHIVEHYQIGTIAETYQWKAVSDLMNTALFDQEKRTVWKPNLLKAATELCWENEEVVLRSVYEKFL